MIGYALYAGLLKINLKKYRIFIDIGEFIYKEMSFIKYTVLQKFL